MAMVGLKLILMGRFLSGLSIDGLKTGLEIKWVGLVWGEEKRFGLN
jgi:hypothetical protein